MIKTSCTHQERLTLIDFHSLVERLVCKGCFKVFWVKSNNGTYAIKTMSYKSGRSPDALPVNNPGQEEA